MVTSDVRRGPGWWMDLEGGWNPPEEWPESSPPLPGWQRNHDGTWSPPADDDGAIREPSAEEVAAVEADAPTTERRVPLAQQPAVRAQLSLTRETIVAAPEFDPAAARRRALSAAATAAITASMIAGGIVLLLLIL